MEWKAMKSTDRTEIKFSGINNNSGNRSAMTIYKLGCGVQYNISTPLNTLF